jgi:hypothetical protein
MGVETKKGKQMERKNIGVKYMNFSYYPRKRAIFVSLKSVGVWFSF